MKASMKWMACAAVAMAVMMSTTSTVHAQDNGITQGEMAMMMANMLSLDLPVNASAQDAIAALIGVGVQPLNGWQPDAPVVLGDLAVTLVQALGAEADVVDPADPQSYIDLLNELGVSLTSVTGALGAMSGGPSFAFVTSTQLESILTSAAGVGRRPTAVTPD
jgi:hypothetical protein